VVATVLGRVRFWLLPPVDSDVSLDEDEASLLPSGIVLILCVIPGSGRGQVR
jgi:hypothetical protein